MSPRRSPPRNPEPKTPSPAPERDEKEAGYKDVSPQRRPDAEGEPDFAQRATPARTPRGAERLAPQGEAPGRRNVRVGPPRRPRGEP